MNQKLKNHPFYTGLQGYIIAQNNDTVIFAIPDDLSVESTINTTDIFSSIHVEHSPETKQNLIVCKIKKG